MSFDLIWFDILIIGCFFLYAYKFLLKTPAYKSQDGFGTKRSRKSPEAWALAQRVAGIYCLVAGVIQGVLVLIQEFVLKDLAMFNYITYGVELVLIIVLYPLVNLILKNKFGDK